ncbi:MAG: cupin domain-containing protein [Minicystis sp.]
MSPDAFSRLAALLDPLDPGAFFDRCWEREPLHLRAEGRRAHPLITHDALLAALDAAPSPPEGLLAFPEHFEGGPPGVAALLADPGRLRAYLDAGHPIVWNRARGVFPAVDALAAALAEALGAHVWPNVYATGTAGTPFETHFDCHEVIAVHCEGTKAWTISAVRVDRPLDARAMEPSVRAAMAARRAEAEARTALQFTVDPGDVVYIPRGQFHNAATPAGRSLHVTFGIRQLSGVDVAEIVMQLALGDPALREYLPPVAADPGGERARARLDDIRARLVEILLRDDLLAAVGETRAHAVRRSGID